MKQIIKIRKFKVDDIKDILEIYNHHIVTGLSNFEEKPILFKNFKTFCNSIIKEKLPFIIGTKNKKIVGFSYLTNFRNKSGYRFSFENSVYIHQDYTGMGIGNILLSELIKQSKKNNKIKTIVAVIGSSSIASIKIHKKNNFKHIGTLKKIGFKKNKWLDVIYMQKILLK